MQAYQAMQAQLAKVSAPDGLGQQENVVVIPELTDHEDEAGSVHVDALRAICDWVTRHHPKVRFTIAAAARRHTPLAMEEFGMSHLASEYPSVRFVDLNEESMPTGYRILVCRASKNPQGYWNVICQPAQRLYSPRGVVWQREASGDAVLAPHLTLVDGRS